MQILNTHYPYAKPAFKSCVRTYTHDFSTYPESTRKLVEANKTKKGIPVNTSVLTATHMFRGDLNWFELVEFINKNFADKPKVQSYSIAASDGSEAYTYAISVMDRLPKEVWLKYLPVYASDIDAEVIKAAQTGKINLKDSDIWIMDESLKRPTEYFKCCGNALKIENDLHDAELVSKAYEPIPILKNAVKFEQDDILHKISSIKDEGNSVILCRNVTPYLGQSYVKAIVKKVNQILQKGSLFIIGEFDCCTGIDELLKQTKFKQCADFVFRKI